MSLLGRYIFSHVMRAALLVLCVLFGINTLIALLGEMFHIGVGNYGVLAALRYVLLTTPVALYHFVPMIGLLGGLIGLGLLASHHEITVMRVSGMSTARIYGIVLAMAVPLTVLFSGIGEGIGPQLAQQAAAQRFVAQHERQMIRMQGGGWVRDGNDFIHVGAVLPGDRLQNVTDFHFNDQQQLQTARFAKEAVFTAHGWTLRHVGETDFQSENRLTARHVAEQPWSLNISPKLFGAFLITPAQMTLWKLYHYIQYRVRNGLNATRYEFIFWQRLFQPLALLVMLSLSLPFLFGSLRAISVGVRVATGLAIGLSFYALNRFFQPMTVVLHIPPPVAAALPLALFGAVSVFLMRRVK